MVESLGFGTYGLSGAYGKNISKRDKINLIKEAFKLGIRYFDTSPSYGESEKILAKALKDKRSEIKIATKVGVSENEFDLSPDGIKDSVNKSLERLDTDYLDLLFIHYHDPEANIENVVEELEGLKRRGIVKNIGLGHLQPNVLNEYLKYLDNPFIMTEYNIINSLNYKRLVENTNSPLIAFSITARGVFANPEKKRPPLYIKSVHSHIKRVSEFLNKFSEKYNLTKTQLAVLYAIQSERVKYALTGPTKVEHLVENVKAVKQPLRKDDYEKITSFLKQKEILLKKEVFRDIDEILQKKYADIKEASTDLIYLIENTTENNLIDYDQAIEVFLRVKKLSKSKNIDEVRSIQKRIKSIIKH